MQAILTLDAYQRGYNTTEVVADVQGVYDFEINLAANSSANAALIRGVDHESIGFYALFYDSKDDGDFVVYRGTDDGFEPYDQGTDVRNGFGIGLGLPHGPQGKAAVDFYNSIVDLHGGGNPFASPIQVTGQSLGGGLAGYVSALYDKDATLFAHMPYDLAAKNAHALASSGAYPQIPALLSEEAVDAAQAIVDFELKLVQPWADVRLLEGLRGDAWLDPEGVIDMVSSIYGDLPVFPAPDIEGIESFHIKNEALYVGRLLACLNQDLIAEGIQLSCDRGSSEPLAKARIGHYIDSFPGDDHPSAAEKHFQSTFVINAFGYTDEVQDDAWQIVMPDFWPALFDESVAVAAGNTKLFESAGGLKQDWEPEDISNIRIAYSVIDEGKKPQGDAAIRAIYDDAIELGTLVESGKAPSNLLDSIPGLAEIIVQYAGQLARQEAQFQNPKHAGLDLDQGVLSFAANGNRLPQTKSAAEVSAADMLLIDFSKARWNASDLNQKRENDQGPQFDPDRPVLAEGLDELLDSVYDVKSPTTIETSEFAQMLELLYGEKQKPDQDEDLPFAAPYIARVDYALSDELAEVHLANAIDPTQGLPDDQATLFVGNDNRQKIFGTDDNNIVIGGEESNILIGRGGRDILVGRDGSDSFIDTIGGQSQTSDSSLTGYDDIYIGGEQFEFEPWRLEFLERWVDSLPAEEALEFLEFESDKVYYTLLTEPNQLLSEIPPLGLVVNSLTNTKLGDAEAVELSLLNRNDNQTSTDILVSRGCRTANRAF